ncbi:MAG: class I SAM-dependent methyltransferase [Acidobacteria bacterium]|nr:class I SAM-dependent methyltransferase [Acidobacteriota bacterium]
MFFPTDFIALTEHLGTVLILSYLCNYYLIVKCCYVCQNKNNNKIYRAREMMFGWRDQFDYFECGECGTIQIVEAPELSRFYPPDYYSFGQLSESRPEKLESRIVKKMVADYYGNRRNLIGKFFSQRRRETRGLFPFLFEPVNLGITTCSRILDFGSGNGEFLLDLRWYGFEDLTGVDAFIEKDIVYSKSVRVLKRELKEIELFFDLITAHHSIEHLPNPRVVLREFYRLLRHGKYALIRLPVAAYAWRHYKTDWVQLDAPRHLFLFTERAFRRLAEEAGFTVEKVVYDSTAFQFLGSELYQKDIPLSDKTAFNGNIEESIFTFEQLIKWEKQAAKLNEQQDGDQACFYLRKN